jgi:hypothetical protein
VQLDKRNCYSFSVFENDSQDQTKMWLQALDWSFFKKKYINITNLNIPFYSNSEKYASELCRVQILSQVRNLAIDQVGEDLNLYDKIVFIEPESLFYPKDIVKLIELSIDTDIYSPKGIMEKSHMIGDIWATRINKEDEIYNGNPIINEPNDYLPVWSTYSYVCIYDIKPILEGLRFGFFNKRFNKPDCDTAIICENFRDKGYDRIFINTNIKVTQV